MRGFSLIETIVVISILGVVGVALGQAIQYFYRGNAYVFEETVAIDSARQGLTSTLENIRAASYGDDGSYPILSAATSTLSLHTDTNGDGSVELVRLYFSNATLYRGVTFSAGNPPSYAGQPEHIETLATYVKNTDATPLFTYYDANGAVLSPPIDVAQVASVAVLLRTDINPNRAPDVYTLTGTATIRNLLTY